MSLGVVIRGAGCSLGGGFVILKMVDRVKPLAHAETFLDLLLDLILTKGLQEQEADCSVEGSCVQPNGKKSLAHDWSEVALLDVKHVGGGEECAGTVGGLNHALRVVESVDNSLVDLPIVVIHLLCIK